MNNWSKEAIFYHIYPLGLCGAPLHNDLGAAPMPRLEELHGWLDHLQRLGVTALYLGPIFESTAHGYDTADYYHLDRRLGTDEALARFSAALHQKGMRLVLDGVFNHVGRDFWAFKDVREKGRDSSYCDWFYGLNFNRRSPYGDPFYYEGWNGHYDLVKLNLNNPAVREHLFGAVEFWIKEFNVDGLRLDAADVLDHDFMQALSTFCRNQRPDFWLMGEVIHGDYRRWANPQTLDSVTNYEGYKSLYSSHLDKNYFELAYSVNRQYGEGGIYRDLTLYNFADNHDVDRVVSRLANPAHLYPLYCLLFTLPGIPSIYYGSEWGIEGKRTASSDRALRPRLELASAAGKSPQSDLARVIERLAALRHASPALKEGDYCQLVVKSEQFAFARRSKDRQENIIVAVNSSDKPASLEIDLRLAGLDGSTRITDLLNEGESFEVQNGRVCLESLWPQWGRILRVE
jgi:glycosidase